MDIKKDQVIQLDVIEIIQKLGIDLDKLKATNLFPEEIARLERRPVNLEQDQTG